MSIDYFKYENEFVFSLPKEMQDNILNLLNRWDSILKHYWENEFRAENEDTRNYCREQYHKFKHDIDVALRVLMLFNIYPAIGWDGHEQEYFFPTKEDCEHQEKLIKNYLEGE